jgi:hypothetical protein
MHPGRAVRGASSCGLLLDRVVEPPVTADALPNVERSTDMGDIQLQYLVSR